MKKKKKREFKFQRREKDGKSRDYRKGISNTEKMRRKRYRMKKVWQEEDEVAAQKMNVKTRGGERKRKQVRGKERNMCPVTVTCLLVMSLVHVPHFPLLHLF